MRKRYCNAFDVDEADLEPWNERFQPLHANAYSGLHSVVAVPSRLYYPVTFDRPLNGKRVSVKDLFHLEGMVTTIGSRSYAECYGVQKSTAKYIQHLIDKGAVIVGKTKMGAYAGSEIPPEKCIDYFPPWNPRGDGYQGPSGSSSGAGSSVAGYPWLDYALATDSTCRGLCIWYLINDFPNSDREYQNACISSWCLGSTHVE